MAKLLLVEDDNNLREIYEARLQAEGYTIVSAKDGEEALVVAKAEKPDLVIADVMMPKISGFEMLDIMRNTDELKGVKVIMLTALGQSDDQQRADKLGADRYLVKSQVTLEDIVKVTHELLDSDAAPGAAPPAPATEPAAKPAPAPAAEPKPEPATPPAEPAEPAEPKPAPDASASDAAAKSTVQEEADVEAKIEDFVAGASSEPTTPASSAPAPEPAAKPAPAPVAEPKPEPVAGPAADTKSADSASDDKLMADAVEKLVANTDDKDEEAKDKEPSGDAAPSAPETTVVAPTVIPVSVAPDDKPDEDEAAKPEADKEEDKKEDGTGLVGGNRVIKPLESSEHKKDIKQLLAEEDAKEAQAVPGNVIVGGTKSEDPEDKPAGQSQPTPGSTPPAGGVDPNSIAL